MSQTGKLYKYHLKKILGRNGRVGGIILCTGIWWVAFSFISSFVTRKNFEKNFDSFLTEEEKKIFNEEFSWREITKKSYQGVFNFDKKSVEGGGEKAKEESNLVRKKFYQKVVVIGSNEKSLYEIKMKNMSKEEIGKEKYSSMSSADGSPHYRALTEFSARRPTLGSWDFLELINNISSGSLGGALVASYLAYYLVDYLFIQPKKIGEDAIILNFVSPAKRGKLFISKSLSYITTFAVFSLLSFVIPFGIFLFFAGPVGFPGTAYSLLALWTTVVSPIIFFLFPISIYLFASNFGIIGTIVYFLFSYFPTFWLVSRQMLNYLENEDKKKLLGSFIAKLEYGYNNFLFRTGLAVIVGCLAVTLYYYYYREEDLR